MDYEFEGCLQYLYCEFCKEKIVDIQVTFNHRCLKNFNVENLAVIGNVISVKGSFLQNTDEYDEVVDTEYLEEFEEHVQNGSTKNSGKEAISSKEVTPTNLLTIDEDLEINEEGIAYASQNNLIKLIEYVRDNPCTWNHTLPVHERNQYTLNNVWTHIANKFPGWSAATARKQFANLRSAFFRRNITDPSGSAGRKKKPCPYTPYFTFLRDISEPGSTISNVSPPKPNKSNENIVNSDSEKENDSQLADFGFSKENGSETPMLSKKLKSIDPVEKVILQTITNRASREIRPQINQWQQWGSWLSKEIEDIPDAADRIEIQASITHFIAKKNEKSKLVMQMTYKICHVLYNHFICDEKFFTCFAVFLLCVIIQYYKVNIFNFRRMTVPDFKFKYNVN